MPGDDVFMPGDDFFMVDDGSAGDLPVPSVVPVPRVATDREELEEKKNRARNTQQRNAFPSGKGQFGASKPKLPGRASKASDKQLRPYGGGVSKRNATTVKHALKIAWQGKGKEGVTKPSAQEKSKQPLRTRAEGGRKRRPKNK